MINLFIHLTTFKESHFLFIIQWTCYLIAKAHSIKFKGENHLKSRSILYFHLCLSWKKISLILPLIHLHSLASNETKWNWTERGCKTVKWFHEFFIGYLCLNSDRFTCRAVNSYGKSNWWKFISFLVLKQIFLVWQVIHHV